MGVRRPLGGILQGAGVIEAGVQVGQITERRDVPVDLGDLAVRVERLAEVVDKTRFAVDAIAAKLGEILGTFALVAELEA